MDKTIPTHEDKAEQSEKTTFCCQEKSVGRIGYTLSREAENLPDSCISSCTYTRDTDGRRFCFARGTLPVVCLEEG